MTKILKEQVDNIANLARLYLSEEEKKGLQSELSSILEMVDRLDEVKTPETFSVQNISGLKNEFRDDQLVKSKIETEDLLRNAPEKENGFIKVKKVLE